MKWQCSIRDLLIATAIVAVGLGGLRLSALVINYARAVIAFCSFAVIGAGLLTPFHKKKLGAILGVVLPSGFALLMHLLGLRF